MDEQQEEPLSRRERRWRRTQERELQADDQEKLRVRKKRIKRIRYYLLILIILGLVGWFVYYELSVDRGPRWSSGNVHWHANIRIETCGEYRSLDKLGSERNHVGNSLLHTHGDNLYHLEGKPVYAREATLGAFFDAINVPFANDHIFQYENGDTCSNGTIGTLKMMVNEKPVMNLTDYVPKDKDNISIIFGG